MYREPLRSSKTSIEGFMTLSNCERLGRVWGFYQGGGDDWRTDELESRICQIEGRQVKKKKVLSVEKKFADWIWIRVECELVKLGYGNGKTSSWKTFPKFLCNDKTGFFSNDFVFVGWPFRVRILSCRDNYLKLGSSAFFRYDSLNLSYFPPKNYKIISCSINTELTS